MRSAAFGQETTRQMKTSSKNSVAFIMNSETVVVQDATVQPTIPASRSRQVRSPAMDEKRRTRECRVDGCENDIINKGLCFRHGGGKKCSVEGCQSSAKHSGLCWKHGGWVKCQVESCDRRGKSRGLCWSHGGGTKCSHGDCSKVAVSNGLCWAHGGGKRCIYKGCKKAAYERNNNYCTRHHGKQDRNVKTVNV